MTDFREGGLLALPPPLHLWAALKRPSWIGLNKNTHVVDSCDYLLYFYFKCWWYLIILFIQSNIMHDIFTQQVLISQKEYLCTLVGDVWTCKPNCKNWASIQCLTQSALTSLTTRFENAWQAWQALYEKTSI